MLTLAIRCMQTNNHGSRQHGRSADTYIMKCANGQAINPQTYLAMAPAR
ncbi:MAG: hypothetical protein U1E91_05390 [Moraxella sp.]